MWMYIKLDRKDWIAIEAVFLSAWTGYLMCGISTCGYSMKMDCWYTIPLNIALKDIREGKIFPMGRIFFFYLF